MWNFGAETIQQSYTNRPLNTLISCLKKRNIEESNIETHDNNGKPSNLVQSFQ
ncbi:hypothetical protein C1645_842433 [Glomus cerebriforme]|uniref:Uncharacterized protein n=1 Tax=Glomus cerebriforme TaxID=658196 RepID=A0A397RYG4_9GLOM|nr:hypothetical protein C1645_842433 [Glomus cerebriforme]